MIHVVSYRLEIFSDHKCSNYQYCTSYIAICTPACLNNGTCSSPGVCNCTAEWSGERCGDRKLYWMEHHIIRPAQLVRLLQPWPYHFLTMALKKFKYHLMKFMVLNKDMITLTILTVVNVTLAPLTENFVHNFPQTKLQNLILCSKSP